MAPSAKHLSRKELREPDRFMAFTQRALGFVKERRQLFAVAGALIVVMIIGISAWQIYKSRQNEQAAQRFDNAMTKLLSVSHQEMQRRLAADPRGHGKKKKRKHAKRVHA